MGLNHRLHVYQTCTLPLSYKPEEVGNKEKFFRFLSSLPEIGVVGFGPTIMVSKTSALPLGYTPGMLKSGIEPLTSGFSVQHSTTELLELT